MNLSFGFFQNIPSKLPQTNPPGSFIIYPPKIPSGFIVNVPFEFFHKIPQNLITMYSTTYPMGSLRVYGKIEPHWGFFVSTLKRTHWVHCDQILGYFMKELKGCIYKEITGYFGWVHYERTWWVCLGHFAGYILKEPKG